MGGEHSGKELLQQLMLLLFGTSTMCAFVNDGDDLLDEITRINQSCDTVPLRFFEKRTKSFDCMSGHSTLAI